MIPNLKILLIIAAFISSIGASVFITSRYKDGQYAIKEQKVREEYIVELQKRQEEYNRKVEELNRKALQRQTELANLNSKLERKYAKAIKHANNISEKYNALIAYGWRLYDPGNKTMSSLRMSDYSSSTNSTASNSNNRTSSSRELSRKATEFLLGFATDADKVVEQLKVSQEYALKLKEICENQ